MPRVPERVRRALRRGPQMGWMPNPIDTRDLSAHSLHLGGFARPRGRIGDTHPRAPGGARDQGPSSRCVAYAIMMAILLREREFGRTLEDPSVNHIYAWARAQFQDARALTDQGCYIRSACRAVRSMGAPPESVYPSTLAGINEFPAHPDYHTAGYARSGLQFRSIPDGDVDLLVEVLAKGIPVIHGLTITGWFSGLQGDVLVDDMPGASRGGHAMVMHTLDENGNPWNLNSWGVHWGDLGWCRLEREFVRDRCRDMTAVYGWNKIAEAERDFS